MVQRVLETLSLYVLISVVVLRPIIAESYDSAQNPLTASLAAVEDPTPVRTLVLDLFILFGAAGWLIARAIGPVRRYRRTGLEWGFGLVAAAAVISCFFAGQKRLAINATIDWLCYPILAIALTQLMIRPWHRRVLLAAVLATACSQSFQCLEQSLVGYEDTWEHYESIKTDFWADQGVPLDSPKVDIFERRIRSGEATGGSYHSNVTGSYLVLCGMGALGLTIAAWRRKLDTGKLLVALATSAITALLITAVVTTNSLGAAISAAVGLSLWMIIHWFRSWIGSNRSKAVLIGWMLAAGGVVATVGHGLYHDSLPGWSLTFRWQWWKASARLIADHPLTGVGRENFRRNYLGYKSIESPEEVANPHNLLVQAAADWGAMGLVGVIVMMIGVSSVLAKPVQDQSGEHAGRDPPTLGRFGGWAVALVCVVVFARLPLLGTDDPNFLYYATVTTTIVWLFGFLTVTSGSSPTDASESRGGTLVAIGVAIGIFTFLLHDMINFAFFVPGAATTVFGLLAYCVAERSMGATDDRSVSPLNRWGPVGGVVAVVLCTFTLGLLPVARSDASLQRARVSAGNVLPVDPSAQRTVQYFLQAADRDELDPTPVAECAAWLIQLSRIPELRIKSLELAETSLDRAIDRDPSSLRLRRMRVQLYQRIAYFEPTKQHHDAATEAARQALALYPQDPHGYVSLGDCQLDAGRTLESEESLRSSVESYRHALELDNKRLWWEELHRFGDVQRQRIEDRINEALGLLARQP